MIRTGNYFWPTINGHLYYDKPLGSYWLVLAATWIMGGLGRLTTRRTEDHILRTRLFAERRRIGSISASAPSMDSRAATVSSLLRASFKARSANARLSR